MMTVKTLDLDEPQAPKTVSESIVFVSTIQVRLRVRRVNEHALAAETRQKAIRTGSWAIRCRHGGSVANAYKYPADTEAVLAVSNPAGLTVVWMARLPANKVTLAGSANACLSGSRALFDKRYGEAAAEAVWENIKALHRLVFPPTAHERLLSDDLLENESALAQK